jgi:4-hydroxy-tetrahydrodipicolinate synthase
VKDLGRLLTAMVTPFDDDGEVDYEQARKLALALLESGSDGVVVSGTTGESPTLSRDEKMRLFAEVKSAIGEKGTVIAGTGSYGTRESIELSGEAEKAGVDAILLVVPYYNKPTQQGLVRHFEAIARSVSLPCLLYNVPARTVTSLEPETVVKLSQIENIVGLKEAGGPGQAAKVLELVDRDFLLYSGNDDDTYPIVSLGGYGVISVASHLVGLQIKEMIVKAARGEKAEAEQLHMKLMPLFKAMFVVSNPMPVKYALDYLGFRVGAPRLPLTPLDGVGAAAIEATLKDYHIDLPLHSGA